MPRVSFTLNGDPVAVEARPDQTLLDVLRNVLGMTGTKAGCKVGECGACTVIVDGDAVLSCLTLAGKVEGRRVETIEGLAGEQLHPLQAAFLEEDAVACGFCTPGMIMSAKALLDANPHPSDEEIRVAVSGNLCRCTGYAPVLNAIRKVR